MNSSVVLFLFVVVIVCSEDIPEKTNDELIYKIQSDDQVAVLFLERNCKESNKVEKLMERLSKRYKEDLNADVVKTYSVELRKKFCPSSEPAFVVFYYGEPMQYQPIGMYNQILAKLQYTEPVRIGPVMGANGWGGSAVVIGGRTCPRKTICDHPGLIKRKEKNYENVRRQPSNMLRG